MRRDVPRKAVATSKILALMESRGIGGSFSTVDVENECRLGTKTYWTILKRFQDRGLLRQGPLVYEKEGSRGQRSWKIVALNAGDQKVNTKVTGTHAGSPPSRVRSGVAQLVEGLPIGEKITASWVMEKTGLSRATTHEAIQRLVKAGTLVPAGTSNEHGGRPAQLFEVSKKEAKAGSGRAALARFLGLPKEKPSASPPPNQTSFKKEREQERELAQERGELLAKELFTTLRGALERYLDEKIGAREHLRQKSSVLSRSLEDKNEELLRLERAIQERDQKISELSNLLKTSEEELKKRELLGSLLDSVATRMTKSDPVAQQVPPGM